MSEQIIINSHFENMGHGQRVKLFKKAKADGTISKEMTFDEFDKGLPKNKTEFWKK